MGAWLAGSGKCAVRHDQQGEHVETVICVAADEAGSRACRLLNLERDILSIPRVPVHQHIAPPAIKTRMLEIGVTGVAPERRSPEYLAKYVADEVGRWEGPIKDGGLQVD